MMGRPLFKSHICMLVDTEVSRDSRVRREAGTMVRAGHSVHLFCIRPNKFQLPPKEFWEGVHITRIPLSLPRLKMRNRKTARLLATISLRSRQRFDVIHAHDLPSLHLAHWMATLHRCPIIYDSHEYWASILNEEKDRIVRRGRMDTPSGQRRLRELERLLAFEDRMLPRVTAVIGVSDALSDLLSRRHALPRHLRITLRNCASATGAGDGNPRLFHDTYGLPEHKKILLYQGRIADVRGIDYLLDMLPLLTRDDLVLMLMGPVSVTFRRRFRERLDDHRLKGKVYYKEEIPADELPAWTASADLGLCPVLAWSETRRHCLPNKVFEYVQAGIPQAVSDQPAMKQLVESHDIGFTLDPEDPSDMADKIETYFNEPSLRERFMQNIRRHQHPLSWEQEAHKLIELYAKVLATPSAER